MKKFDMAQYLNKASQPQTSLTIHRVSVYDMEPNPQNFYAVGEIESLAAMIELQGGVITPLELAPGDDGRYKIIAGHRRRAAMLHLLEQGSSISPLLPAFIRTYATAEEETLALIFSNRGQRKRTADEITEEINQLRPIAKRIFDEEKAKGTVSGRFRKFFAEEILGISETNLQRRTQLANLSGEIKEELKNGSLTLTAAAELAGLDPEQQEHVLRQAKAEDKPATVERVLKAKNEQKAAVAAKPAASVLADDEPSETAETRGTPADAGSFKQLQDDLVRYKKDIDHAFSELILYLQDCMENSAAAPQPPDLSKVKRTLARVSADIDQLQRR